MSSTTPQKNENELHDESMQKKAETLGILYLPSAPELIANDILTIMPEDVARRHNIMPFAKRDDVICLAMTDPENVDALNAVRFIAEDKGLSFEIYLAAEGVFGELLQKYKSAEGAVSDVIESFESDAVKEIERIKQKEVIVKENYQDAPVAKLVHVVVRHAIDGKASDIHVEPMEHNYRIRFRVDGVLHSSLTLPNDVGRAFVSRIKILSHLKIDEKRKPQDGRFSITENNRSIDFRVSSMPVAGGEKVVLRILEKDSSLANFETLGIMGRNLEILKDRISEPFGIILNTGPTGSGKSTTLYAFLQLLNKEERNIITLEDPVEYFIDGINQSQVRPELGYTFANGLRSILRQDPNVIMVGEIRDSETAELAIHAALTGHLVFSTLHTNDSVGAVPRLIDMGIEPFLLAASLREVAAQRLVRRICSKCKETVILPERLLVTITKFLLSIPDPEKEKYGIDVKAPLQFYKGQGCDACGKTGYKGRVGIYEVIGFNKEIEAIISERNGSSNAIKETALKNGMITMKHDGLLKALLGLTTLEEIERVTEGSLTIGGDLEDA